MIPLDLSTPTQVTSDTTIATFTCTVDDGYTRTTDVTFGKVDVHYGTMDDNSTIDFTYSPVSISIAGATPATGITTTPTSVTLEQG